MNVLQFNDQTQRTLGHAISMQARQQGAETFILCDDVQFSFAEVDRKVNELAGGLAQRGIGRGDRVVFYMASAAEVIFLVLAANKLGAVWVPVNTDYKGAWLEDTIRRSRPSMLVTDSERSGRIDEVRTSLSLERLVVLGDLGGLAGVAEPFASLYQSGAAEPDMSELRFGDISAVLWTSGTTGRSKGVKQSHNVWFNAAEAANAQYGIDADDVIYSVLPMYNTAAWVTAVFRALIAGVPLALDPAFSVARFWQRIDFYRATQSFTLGAMHMFLWDAPPAEDDARHSLRKLMAVPMPPAVAGPFSERFGLQLVPQGLGQSEAMMLTNQMPGYQCPPGSCGRLVDLLDGRLVDDEGNDVAQGEAGELWVRPRQPQVFFSGYFDDEQATAAAFEGQWYKTGDLLKRDAAGNYYFSDRKKDAVRYKGRNVSTFEVEMAARRHPAVADCAAFGVPSAQLASESELKLDVLMKPGQSLAPLELAQFINDNAPYFFVPRYIELVDALPYTPTNKVQKFKLRERGVTEGTWDGQAEGFVVRR